MPYTNGVEKHKKVTTFNQYGYFFVVYFTIIFEQKNILNKNHVEFNMKCC